MECEHAQRQRKVQAAADIPEREPLCGDPVELVLRRDLRQKTVVHDVRPDKAELCTEGEQNRQRDVAGPGQEQQHSEAGAREREDAKELAFGIGEVGNGSEHRHDGEQDNGTGADDQ